MLPAHANEVPLILDHGHVDAFNVKVDDGKLVINLIEDVTAPHTEHRPEDVILKVKEKAFITGIPATFPGAPSGYVLPLTQERDLLWPGWNTNGTTGSGYTDVKIVIESVDGPGAVHLYTLAGFGQVTSLLEGGGYTLPGTLHEAVPAHTHAQWTFAQAGEYKLKVHAAATNPITGATLTSMPANYQFSVGETTAPPAPVETTAPPAPVETAAPPAPVETAAPPAPVETAASPAPVETTAPPAPVETTAPPAPVETTAPPAATAEPTLIGPGATGFKPPLSPVKDDVSVMRPVDTIPAEGPVQCIASVESKMVEKSVPAAGAPLVLDHGHIDAFNVTAANGKLTLALKEDVTGSHIIRAPEAVLLHVLPAAFTSSIPSGFPGGPTGYVLPLTQDPKLIWPGWDTNATAGSGFTDVKIDILSASGPGTVSLYSTNTFGGASPLLTGGSMTLPGTLHEKTPAHTHAQWSFSAKGDYKLTAKATATNPATGVSITSNTATYNFVVGELPAKAGTTKQMVEQKVVVGRTAAGVDCELSPAERDRAERSAGITDASKSLAATGAESASFGFIGAGALLLGGLSVMLLARLRRREV